MLAAGRALYVGPGHRADLHAHHAVQFCIGLEGPMSVRSSPGDNAMQWDGCVVAPEQDHEFDAGGTAVALLYVEPEGRDGRRVAATVGLTGIAALDDAVVQRVRTVLGAGVARDRAADRLIDDISVAVGLDVASRPLDARIRRAVQRLQQCRGTFPSGTVVAAEVGVSPDRFRHLWLQEIGLAYRRYVLWLRLRAALMARSRGLSLTEAAHEAGFADSAHLSRTFRRLLGIAPSAMPVILDASLR